MSKDDECALIYTATTFLSLPNKLDNFVSAIGCFLSIHSRKELECIKRFVIINEYDADETQDHAGNLARRLAMYQHDNVPFEIEIIQKCRQDAGQVKSLNMIVEMIQSYKYWIHWEESWFCSAPFIHKVVRVMEESNADQLQLTDEWYDAIVANKTTKLCSIAYHIVERDPAIMVWLHSIDSKDQTLLNVKKWPLYSLRPSINRVAFITRIGCFDENPMLLPPWRTEWEYAVRWYQSGGTKAILSAPIARRFTNHKSTY